MWDFCWTHKNHIQDSLQAIKSSCRSKQKVHGMWQVVGMWNKTIKALLNTCLNPTKASNLFVSNWSKLHKKIFFSDPHTLFHLKMSWPHRLFVTHPSSPALTHPSCKSDNFIVHYTDSIWTSDITTRGLKIHLKAGSDRFTVHDINNMRSWDCTPLKTNRCPRLYCS